MAKLSGYNETMVTANISELKNRLSHYLRLVQRGERVLVLDRDRVIARLEAAGADTAREDSERIADLERRGVVRPPSEGLPEGWLLARPAVSGSAVAAVLEEREESR
jgi:antitoxin (DNA-binding transcriptional repressor) of toxin-antitoxin stability system